MPIINIQRRMAEQGRIRLGHKVVGTTKTGKKYTRPAKLDRFRFTSPNAALIEQIARLYGGKPEPWDNNGKPEHEVYTDATSIPVIVVKGGLSQWMETWSGGGCIHRCDGETNVLTDAPCDLQEMVQIGRDTVNPHAVAKPTTRLSVMLSDVESLGVWRMETHGWNAAAEIPAMAELAMHVGDLVPATLHLVERRAVRDGETSRFVVPVLDLHVTKKRLVELVGGVGGTAALEGGQSAPALEAARPDYAAVADTLLDVESVKDLWKQAAEAGHLDDAVKAALTARAEQIKAEDVSDDPTDYDEDAEPEKARAAARKRAANHADEPVDAEVVDDDAERAAVWQQLLAVAGERGMGMDQVREAVEQHTAQAVSDCTAEQLAEVFQLVTTGEVVSA